MTRQLGLISLAPAAITRNRTHNNQRKVSMPQSYSNHAYQPVLTYVAALFLGLALAYFIHDLDTGSTPGKMGAICLALAVAALVSISRIYTTRLQNRIIRLEMQVRLKELLPPEQRAQIGALTTPQLVALRFASDGELPGLVQRAAAEKLSRDAIKKAIRDWRPDEYRT